MLYYIMTTFYCFFDHRLICLADNRLAQVRRMATNYHIVSIVDNTVCINTVHPYDRGMKYYETNTILLQSIHLSLATTQRVQEDNTYVNETFSRWGY
jgi:hypothetical protein